MTRALRIRASGQAELDRALRDFVRAHPKGAGRPVFLVLAPKEPLDLSEWLWLFTGCPDCPSPADGRHPRCCKSPTQDPAIPAMVVVSAYTGAPMYPGHVRAIARQCAEADVPFRFTGWGEWMEEQMMVGAGIDARTLATTTVMGGALYGKVGKKLAGRRLDCQEHNGRPPA